MTPLLAALWSLPFLLTLMTYFEDTNNPRSVRLRNCIRIFWVSAAAIFPCAAMLTTVIALSETAF